MPFHVHYDKEDLKAISSLMRGQPEFREDALVGLAQKLDYLKSKVYESTPTQLEGSDILPVDTEIPEWAEFVTVRVYDQVGMAKIIANYADDLPRADVASSEKSVRLKDVGASYGFNLTEIRQSAVTGEDIPARKGRAARWAIDVKLAQIMMQGDPDFGLDGLLTTPNIGIADPTNGDWDNATAEEIVRDVAEMIQNIRTQSNDIHQANQIYMGGSALFEMKNTYMANTGDSAYDVVMRNHPGLTITGMTFLDDVSGSRTAFVGEFSVDYIAHLLPMRFTQLPAETRNLELVVNCLARSGGVVVYRPLAFSKATNL